MAVHLADCDTGFAENRRPRRFVYGNGGSWVREDRKSTTASKGSAHFPRCALLGGSGLREVFEAADDFVDDEVRGGGACGYADLVVTGEPIAFNLVRGLDVVGLDAALA